MTIKSMLLAAAGLLTATAMTAEPAQAQIRCDGPYQIVQGRTIASPYCQDNHLAYVARHHYGMRVSAREIRWNPNEKARVCRAVGHDIRVRTACSGFREDHFRRRFP